MESASITLPKVGPKSLKRNEAFDSEAADIPLKIDAISNRLIVLDMKLDSKPGFVETFAIGLASSAFLKGIGAFVPHVIATLGNIWNCVSSAIKSTPQ
uniref:Uncharacterized protein n=1 Tax=Cajanus cajan TaxID=3821 RepID=A0A151TKK3_CAJCA|nr:hypothetical protein KK1_023927 [Cajanus cajan]